MGIERLAISQDVSIQQVLDRVDDSDAAILQAAIKSDRWTDFEIASACRESGFDVGPRAVARYRKEHA